MKYTIPTSQKNNDATNNAITIAESFSGNETMYPASNNDAGAANITVVGMAGAGISPTSQTL